MVEPSIGIALVIVSVVVGGAIVWLILRTREVREYERGRGQASVELATYSEKLSNQEKVIQELRNSLANVEQSTVALTDQVRTESAARATAEERASRVPELEVQLRRKEEEASGLREKNAELISSAESEKKHVDEKLALLLQAEKNLTGQFENLANRIFEEKSTKFVKQNEENLDLILKPLRVGLQEFKTRVEETYDKESKQRFSLQVEIEKLLILNSKISEDAINLTNALKGQSKTQGAWGELILERVLEGSGLQKGREYDVQVSLDRNDGGRSQPDVLVRLPEGKHVIVDSKVSLTAYEAYSSAEDEESRDRELKRHIESVRRHVTSLSEKNYQMLYGIQSLDFVLMFMPIEPAFMLAVQADRDLFSEAFRKNIMIVSPSTLLVSLKTIASIWRYEYQNKNAQELARQCGALYEKFVGFVSDLEEIGKKIDATRKSYDEAFGKLKTGKGNLIRQVERIRLLGVKPTKVLPLTLIESAQDESGEVADDTDSKEA